MAATTLPADVERHDRIEFRATLQGIDDVVVVIDLEVGGVKPRGARTLVDLNGSAGDRGGPEPAVLLDAGVVVVDLVGADRPLEHIQSYEGKRPVVMGPILRYVLTRHDASVGLAGEWNRLARVRVGPDAGRGDVRDCHEAIQI